MARITLERTAIAGGIGAWDIVAEELDTRQGYSKVFENVTDISRTALTLGAVGLNYGNVESNYSDTVFYASLPLFAKSLYRGAAQAVGRSTTVRAGPSAKSITVRAAPSSGLQPVVQPLGNFRSITA